MRRLALLGLLAAACESPVSEMVDRGPARESAPDMVVATDWIPAPPFGSHVSSYEFFPDSMESSFDSLGAEAVGVLEWEDAEYTIYRAFGDGWEIDVWTEVDTRDHPCEAMRPFPELYAGCLALHGSFDAGYRGRVSRYMREFGKISRPMIQVLADTLKYGVAAVEDYPGYNDGCDPAGFTRYAYDRNNPEDGFRAVAIGLVVSVFEDVSEVNQKCRGTFWGGSQGGVWLHEIGHALADPSLKCDAGYRAAFERDGLFPSTYATYHVEGYHPTGVAASYHPCDDAPSLPATEADSLANGEDVAESFGFWWLRRCRAGDEPFMDRTVDSGFGNRLSMFDGIFSAVPDSAAAASDSVSTSPQCVFDAYARTRADTAQVAGEAGVPASLRGSGVRRLRGIPVYVMSDGFTVR